MCQTVKDYAMKPLHRSLVDALEISSGKEIVQNCLDCIKGFIGTKYDNISNYLEKYKEDGFVWFLECFEMNTPELFRVLWQMKNADYFKYCNRNYIWKTTYD